VLAAGLPLPVLGCAVAAAAAAASRQYLVVRHLTAAAAAVCWLQDYCCLSSLRCLRRLEMFHDWPPASGDIRDHAWLAVCYCTVSFCCLLHVCTAGRPA
jgi:hypothetical protein